MQKSSGLLASHLIKLKNLQLTGKLVSEELMQGIHSSKRSGIGIEFEQYRHYEPGDDPKRIDWKLFARTDKHLVRESSTESDRHIRFVLDLSGSMNYAENGLSRLQYAQVLLASLAYLCYIQNDQMSLYGLREGRVDVISASDASARQAFQKILVGLENVQAAGAWQHIGTATPEFRSRMKEQLIFVSDLLQSGDEWLSWVRSLAGPQREIVVFQILGDRETAFDLQGFYRFRDLESGRAIELDAAAAAEQYRSSMESYLSDVKAALQIPHVRLVRAQMSEPIGSVLKAFLTKRKG